MKTDNDLLEELFRCVVERTGASPLKIDLIIQQFRRQLLANLNVEPAQSLTDKEYEKRLEKMDKEVPVFVNYLVTNDFGVSR